MRILLIDDDPEIRMLAGFVLRRAGHDVATADDGAAGIVAARAARFHVVLLDYRLGDMTGAQVLERLREDPAMPPVVFLTGEDDRATADALIAAGGSGVIAKPFDPETLADRIAALASGDDA